jgi:NADPH2:quinone reductase
MPDDVRARLVVEETLANTMRAVVLEEFGGPDKLKLRTVAMPRLDAGEVLIQTHTAGVGVWDLHMRGGWWPSGRPRFPLILGADGSGTIAAVGARVRRFSPGDLVYSYVWANPKGGFYAEYVAAPADKVAHVPARLDLKHAGAIPVTGLTALQGIDDVLRVKRGESVIVHGASGVVGTLAVQFAKRRGARVLGVATGKDGAALVRRLGADAAIDGRRDDIAEAARRFAPHGIDALLGLSGGEALAICVAALRPGGRFAYPNGVEPLPRKRRGIETISYDAAAGPREFDRLGRAVEETRLKVMIAAEFKLAQAAKAHERLAAGHMLGKVVLAVRR